jgi:hypothetical protein
VSDHRTVFRVARSAQSLLATTSAAYRSTGPYRYCGENCILQPSIELALQLHNLTCMHLLHFGCLLLLLVHVSTLDRHLIAKFVLILLLCIVVMLVDPGKFPILYVNLIFEVLNNELKG